MKRALVWLTNDLRWRDNEAISSAISENEEVLFCYGWDEAFMNSIQLESKRVGEHRKRFIAQALMDLKATLQAIGGELIILKGNPTFVLSEIQKHFDFKRIYVQQPIAWEELQELKRLKNHFQKEQIEWEMCRPNTLYDVIDLPFTIEQLPWVFTDFRKQIEKKSVVRDEMAMPLTIKSPIMNALANQLTFDDLLTEINTHPYSLVPYSGGERETLKHIKRYLQETKAVHHYKETRNELKGILNSSKVSIGLALGCISPRTIYHELQNFEKEYGSNESTYWLYFELLWREFFYLNFIKYPRSFFLKNGLQGKSTAQSTIDFEKLEQWKNGETTNPLINAGMKELKFTGFTTNRMRQLLASYLIYDLKLDWRYGAAYFEEQLIDYDVANNWGNWAYIAGVGNDPRAGRHFNLEKQEARYDKDQSYQAIWNEKSTFDPSI